MSKIKAFIYDPFAYLNGNDLFLKEDITRVYRNYVEEFEKNQQLEARIKELESVEHINEIKAQGIECAVEYAAFNCAIHDDPVSVLEKVDSYAKKLRSNDERYK